jgi:hypothetical protein
MQRAPNTPIDEAIGREIAAREGLSAVVTPSITKLGSSFVLVVSVVLPNGKVMTSTQETLSDVSELPARMDAVGQSLRRALGESSAELARASVPLEQVTSRSLDAVRFYSQGIQRLYAGDVNGGIVLVTRATEIDSTFAMAHAVLGAAYQSQDMEAAAAPADRRAVRRARADGGDGSGSSATLRWLGAISSRRAPFEVLVAGTTKDASAYASLG